MKTNKYFLYARKSSETEDRQMQSIDDQIGILTKLAADKSLDIIEILSEAKSAKAPGRPVFNDMMKRITAGEAQGIVCWKLDRLFRNPVDFGQISWNLQSGVISHIQCSDRSYYPEDNVLLMSVEQGMANQFIRDLSKNTKRGLLRKAERGWYPAHPALGYLHNPNKKKGEKEIIIDEVNFPIVRKMFDLMLTGNYSATQVLQKATEEWGLKNRFGNKTSRNSIYYVFSNPFYYGEYEYPGGSGQFHIGKHQPMITKEEFNLIQKILGRTSQGRFINKYMTYRGLIRCGECGAMITGEEKRKTQKNGNVHEYTYYQCTKRIDPNCFQKTIEVKQLEDQMLSTLSEIELPDDFIQWATETIIEGYVPEVGAQNIIKANQKRELSLIPKKLDNLIELKLNDSISNDEYEKKRRDLIEAKNNLENELSKLPNLERSKEQTIDFMNFSSKLSEKFSIGDDEEKRKIMSIIGANLRLKDRKLEIQLEKPFSIVQNAKLGFNGNSDELARCEPVQVPIKKGTYDDFTHQSPSLLRG